jgi:diketogulonate reductase-like aldo/keto reductase
MNAAAHRQLHHDWRGDVSSGLNEENRYILASGNRMPLLGLGTAQLRHRMLDVLSEAFGAGYRMVDTADEYHTQRGVGDALRRNDVDRSGVFVITRVTGSADTFAAAAKNIGDLKIDYVDLLLLDNAGKDIEVGAWQGLRRARREGLARDIGVSNCSIDQIEDLVYRTGEMPAVNQIEWSPFGHSPRMLDFCRENEILIQASRPLTRGQRLNDDKVAGMAARYGKTAAQLLIRWNLQQGVVPLPKANHVQHLRENKEVFDFEISTTDMAKLNGLNQHYSAAGTLPYV